MTIDREKFRKRLESLGPSEVKRKIALHDWNEEKVGFAQAWLSELEDKSSLEATLRAEGREEQALAFAKEANVTAQEANRIASDALEETRRFNRRDLIIAIAAIIIAAIASRDDIIWLISWLIKQIMKIL